MGRMDVTRYESETQLSGALRWVVRFIWLLGVVVAVGTFAVTLSGRYFSLRSLVSVGRTAVYSIGLNADFYAWYHVTFEVIFAVACIVTGLIIFWRRSDDWMAMLISLTLILYGTRVEGFPIDAPHLFNRDLRPLTDGLLSVGLILSLLVFYVFPSGRFAPRWTKWVAIIWAAWVVSWTLFPESPINLLRWNRSITMAGRAYVAQALFYSTGALAQLYRYRRISSAVERQQTKWVVFGLVFVVAAYIILNLPYVVVPAVQELGVPRLVYGLIHKPLLIAALCMAPLCFAVAMLRYRLWDIGIVVNRALVYSTLTVMLMVIYFGSILALQQIFRPLAMQTSPFAITASTLVIAALFTPLRAHTQQFIDSRFYRQRYDSAQTLAAFAAMLRDEVDLLRLSDRLEEVIATTLQPAHTLCWLRTPTGYNVPVFNEEQQRLVGQSFAWAEGEIPLDDPLVDYLRNVSGSVDLDLLEMDSPALERLKMGRAVLVVPLVSQGDLIGWLTLGARLSELGYSSEDRRMLGALSSQAAPAFRVAQLILEQKSEALERERLHQELKVARLIQQTLLPQEPPEIPGWELAGFYQPAQAVGGDFYDYLVFDDGRVAVIVGDVTDKGIPAALVMATTRSLLRSVAYEVVSPGLVLRQVNKLLYPDIPPGMFVTCYYALLDPATGRLRYANAGHNLPFRRVDGKVAELHARGMPLGLMPGMTYEEKETVLKPDECVLFYSDGLVEAHNPWREMFGSERLRRLIAAHQGDGPSLIRCLLRKLEEFSTISGEQEDDVTLLTLHRRMGHVL